MVITAYEGEQRVNLCKPLIKPTLKMIDKYSNQIDIISERIETFNHLPKESYMINLLKNIT